jgi:hypothetical protein
VTQTQHRTPAEVAIDTAEEAVRASIEAAMKIARATLDAGTDAARKVETSLREALDAVGKAERSKPKAKTQR